MNTVEVELDARAFSDWAMREGWGDGLPCIPPTPELVDTYLTATFRGRDDVLARLLPSGAECTVAHVAANAAMAGAPVGAMPLLCAAVEAIARPSFNLAMQNATTAAVVPALIVNGPVRLDLDLPSGAGCLGGATGPAPAIGRALRLLVRNVAGQRVGTNSESVYGQPARVSGLVVAEWEERSPWPPLAERRGVPGSAVTAYGIMGTMNIVDRIAERADSLLEVIGKSVAFLGATAFMATSTADTPGEVAVAVNPVWATQVLAAQLPSIEDVQQVLWDHAALPIDWFPADHRAGVEATGRVEADGRVHLVASPADVVLFVCGGTGSLHATGFSGYRNSLASTVAVGG
ncbi:MAG: hypothetical protein JWO68_3291 [Actinomycetia bacterium]|nr:hypothetical protein [Actinomycetes bacterium]